MISLDDRDLQILKVLSREGRITKAELAQRINLSPTPCWERLRKLEKAGIITAYRAEISLKNIAPHVMVFVTVELERHRSEHFSAFERAVCERGEIVGCWALGGGFDYLLQIVTRNIDSYQRLIDSLLAQGLGLARYYTYVVTKPVKTGSPPPLEMLLCPPEEKSSG
jgi:Lrp/AsnC family transcriptional regulator of ectoine degradation